jgi:sterol desaturase/sphingolipid hydroxylase (fatty acid hydroxylase superfamily)
VRPAQLYLISFPSLKIWLPAYAMAGSRCCTNHCFICGCGYWFSSIYGYYLPGYRIIVAVPATYQYVPKMGFIEKFLNTHTMHQVHHAQNLEYLDKNHGGYLNLFDKLFGTWVELDEKIDIKLV